MTPAGWSAGDFLCQKMLIFQAFLHFPLRDAFWRGKTLFLMISRIFPGFSWNFRWIGQFIGQFEMAEYVDPVLEWLSGATASRVMTLGKIHKVNQNKMKWKQSVPNRASPADRHLWQIANIFTDIKILYIGGCRGKRQEYAFAGVEPDFSVCL